MLLQHKPDEASVFTLKYTGEIIRFLYLYILFYIVCDQRTLLDPARGAGEGNRFYLIIGGRKVISYLVEKQQICSIV